MYVCSEAAALSGRSSKMCVCVLPGDTQNRTERTPMSGGGKVCVLQGENQQNRTDGAPVSGRMAFNEMRSEAISEMRSGFPDA